MLVVRVPSMATLQCCSKRDADLDQFVGLCTSSIASGQQDRCSDWPDPSSYCILLLESTRLLDVAPQRVAAGILRWTMWVLS